MDRALSIDPGKNHTAVAAWCDGRLVAARLCYNARPTSLQVEAWRGMAESVKAWVDSLGYPQRLSAIIMERPQHYARSNVDPDDLFQLVGVLGAVAGILDAPSAYVHYLPRQWKGNAPKSVTQRRVIKRLNTLEHVVLEHALGAIDPSDQHNLFDAVGIGLHYYQGRDKR